MRPSRKSGERKAGSKPGLKQKRERTGVPAESSVEPAVNGKHEKYKRKEDELTVVGIGASAGGLEALRSMISGLPENANISYVIAQHLDPKHSSALVDLLSRGTKVKVCEIEEGQPVRPNEIYITPPDRNATISNGILHLSKPTTSFGPKPSVDMLFISLAEDKNENAVGIVLSGTGSDGAHGIRKIRANGGITMAQDPATAKYDGMPGAAIGTQCVDLVLPPEKMGSELIRVLQQQPVLPATPKEEERSNLDRIFSLLLEKTGCDFSDYKPTTLSRRIQRRMVTKRVSELNEYVALLETSPDEVKILYRDVLISVTEFFRDPEIFSGLRQVFARIGARKQSGDDIRIWIPGCASGEEAYTVAILLADTLGDSLNGRNVQIFATDIDDEALNRGRSAFYPPAAIASLTSALVDSYFVPSDGGFSVAKRIREMVIFAKHDLVKDPPFAHLDFISCRNVLIYFNSQLQDRVLLMFHYALSPEGYLLLGKSESVGHFSELFQPIGKSAKIFMRVGPLDAAIRNMAAYRPPTICRRELALKSRLREKPTYSEVMNKAILNEFGTAAVVVNERQDVVYVKGDVRGYLGLREGDLGFNVFNMVESPLRHDLRALLLKSSRENTPFASRPIRFTSGNQVRYVTIVVHPVSDTTENELNVVFFKESSAPASVEILSQVEDSSDPRLAEMERELNETRESLQTTVEELETANEELQSLNEELVSTNEELQSSNEELQTTNEELQSSNEELTTVNEELQVKSTELSNAKADLENIQASIGLPLVVVDRQLNLKRLSAEAADIFALHPGDSGQRITSVPASVHMPNLEKDLKHVIINSEIVERKVNSDKKFFRLRILPFIDELKTVGAVLVFIDMTESRRTENTLRQLSSAVEQSPSSVIITNAKGSIEYVNPAFSRKSGFSSEESLGQNPRIVKSGSMPDMVYKDLWKTISAGNIWEGEVCNKKKSGELYWDLVAIAPVRDAEGEISHYVGVQHDISDQKKMQRQLRDLQDHLVHVNRPSELGQMASALAHEINQPLTAIMNYVQACGRLIEGAGGSDFQKAYDMTVKAAEQVERAGAIIQGLKGFAERRRSMRRMEDVNSVIEEALGLALIGARGQGVEKISHLHPGLPPVNMDRIQVQQVLLNLVRNAIEAMETSNRRHLVVSTGSETPNTVEVSVSDTGSGIPEGIADHLFEPFVTTKTDGMGIGLSISHSIIDAHGGRLWHTPNPEGGTVFRFTLPVTTPGSGDHQESPST